jgi:hypothetical protein
VKFGVKVIVTIVLRFVPRLRLIAPVVLVSQYALVTEPPRLVVKCRLRSTLLKPVAGQIAVPQFETVTVKV